MPDDVEDFEQNLPVKSKEMAKLIARGVCAITDLHEQSVVWFVYERTYLYGKEWDEIAESQFLNGVVNSKTGERVRPGLPMSRAKLYKVFSSLYDKGLIHKETIKRGGIPRYRLNSTLIQSLAGDYRVSGGRLASLRGETLHKGNITIGDNTGCAPAQPRVHARTDDMPIDAVTKLQEKFAVTAEKTNAARAKRKKKLNATGLMKIWQDAFVTYFPDDKFFMWRVYEQAAFKKAVYANIPLDVMEEFIIFCVEKFANVIQTRFKWMKQPPLLPNVAFVTKQIEQFFHAFDEANDPNKQLKGRIARSDKPATTKAPSDQSAEVEKLQDKVRRLEGALNEHQQQEITRRRKRIVKAKKLVTNRSRKSDEFGTWDG